MGKGARCQEADNIQYTIYNIQCKKFQQVRGALRVNALASKQRIRNWVLVILAGLGVSGYLRPKAQPKTLVLPPQFVDDVISCPDGMFPEMSIRLSRPNHTSAMLPIFDIFHNEMLNKYLC
uniref:Uncharacterized protein n=1 Tax=Neovison vison TaxID=452646 RepID=A0A8C7EQ52_NEOVI